MGSLRDLLTARQFVTGLLAGAVALVATLPLAVALRRMPHRRGSRPGLIGPAAVVAAVLVIGGSLGLALIAPVPARVVLGLLVLGIAGELAGRAGLPWIVGPLAAVPGGALLVGAHGAPGATWVSVVVLLGPAVAGPAVADLDRRGGPYGIGPVLLVLAVAGMYWTVPDTELARALLGVALPLTILAWPEIGARIGSAGAYAFVGLYLWVVAIEGVGRAGSIVGAVACLGLLLGEPIGHAIARGRADPRRSKTYQMTAAVMVAQVVLVAYASRVVGFESTAAGAALLALPALVTAIVLGIGLNVPDLATRERRGQRARRPRTRRPTDQRNGKSSGRSAGTS